MRALAVLLAVWLPLGADTSAADPVSLCWAASKLSGEQAAQTAGPPPAPVYELLLPGKFF